MSSSFVSSTISRAVSLPLKLYHNYLRPTTTTTTSPVSVSPPSPRNAPTVSVSGSIPSPLTFLTSSYLLLSLSLAFLLHRIHHLVPPAHHRPFQDQQQGQGGDNRSFERVHSRFVQIGVRLPGILYLLKTSAALYLASSRNGIELLKEGTWTRTLFRLLQNSSKLICGKGELGKLLESSTSGGTPSFNHSNLLWQTFLSIACSITLETLVRSLSEDEPNLHSFNLLSFSFLLHVQSHSTTTTEGDNEDNRQLYIYLLLTLLELVSLQISYLLPYFNLRQSTTRTRTTTTTTKRFRFPITLFFSIFSQYLAINCYSNFYKDLNNNSQSPAAEGGGGGGALIWFNKLPEIGFELVVTISLGLKLFAALIRGEELSRENLLGPPIYWDSTEDFAVVLIKYTTQLLKSTRLSNLSYELSPLMVLPSTISQSLESIGFDLSSTSPTSYSTTLEEEEGDGEGGLRIRLERNGDVLLMEELEESRNGNGELLRRRIGKGKSEALEYGFGVEIKKVEIEPLSFGRENLESVGGNGGGGEWDGEWGTGFEDSNNIEYSNRTPPGDVGIGMVQGERRSYFFKFLTVLLRILFYLLYVFIKSLIDFLRFGLRKFGLRSLEGRLKDTWTTRERRRRRERSVGIDQEEEEDEEDEDWKPSQDDDDDDGESNTSEDESDEGEEEEENALVLISDLSKQLETDNNNDESSSRELDRLSPSELAPYLLAHHLSPSSSTTLTRRRYQSLLQPPASSSSSSSSDQLSSIDHLNTAITSSLKSNQRLIRMTKEERESKRQEWRESRSNFCVVCTVEPRTVILWPCRCLALCESCREALALRTTASTPGGNGTDPNVTGGGVPGAGTGGNLCPTCRSAVAGFSRIFIP
ncbi:hypothetical protein JCM3765_000125 [Sporobolomyces pararoseus]